MSIILTYTPEYSNCHESDWSLVNKILRLNHIEFIDLRNFLIENVRSMRGNFRKEYAFYEMNDGLAHLRDIAGLTGDIVNINHYINTLENLAHLKLNWNIDNCNVLKYCPTCIKSGFHSPYYMSPYLSECPIHNVRLETRCPSCTKPIPHILSSHSLKVPYGCPNCGYDLYVNINSPSHIDVSKLENYVENIGIAATKADNWSCLFNFDRSIRWNSSEYANLILGRILHENTKETYFNSSTWEFIDNDPCSEDYWNEASEPWEDQCKMSQNCFFDCLNDTLLRCFFTYQERMVHVIITDHPDKERVKRIWDRVWDQRISTHRTFGRLYLSSNFVINKIAQDKLYRENGMKLMRSFEIMLVNPLLFQLHYSFISALNSTKDDFELRFEVESVIESISFYLERINNLYKFHVVYPNKFKVNPKDIEIVKDFCDISIKESNIYNFCLLD